MFVEDEVRDRGGNFVGGSAPVTDEEEEKRCECIPLGSCA